MLKPQKPNSFWSLPLIPPHPHPLPSASPLFSSFFSLLNCKYQVPFILLFLLLLLLYCSCNFFFL